MKALAAPYREPDRDLLEASKLLREGERNELMAMRRQLRRSPGQMPDVALAVGVSAATTFALFVLGFALTLIRWGSLFAGGIGLVLLIASLPAGGVAGVVVYLRRRG